jgi:hypothetical protein
MGGIGEIMVKFEFAGKKIGIFGIQGSGKTYFARKILANFRAPFIYRVSGDFDNEPNAVIFKPTDKYLDLDTFLHTAKYWATMHKIDAIILDECDLFTTETRLQQGILNEIVLMHRHMGNAALILISRRPQDIPQKIFETCHYVVNFAIDAPIARRKFTELHADYDVLLPRLDFAAHNFIVKEIGQPPRLFNPI